MHQIETNYQDKYVLDIREGIIGTCIKADITRIDSSDRGNRKIDKAILVNKVPTASTIHISSMKNQKNMIQFKLRNRDEDLW